MPTLEPAFQTDRKTLAARLATILPAHCLLVDDEHFALALLEKYDHSRP